MMLFQTVLDPTKLFGTDFFNFLLPWVLTFVISYALLMKLKIFSDSLRPKISLALSFVFAFFVTASAGPQLAGFFMALFGNATIYIIGILIFAMFVSLATNKSIEEGLLGSALFWVTVIVAIVLFLSSGGSIPGAKLDAQTASLIFWGVILLAAIWYITQHKSEVKTTAAEKKEEEKKV